MDISRDIYVASIDNEEPALSETAVQILQNRQKITTAFSANITFSQQHNSSLTYLKEHHAFFDQGRPILDPSSHHHEVFPTTTLEEPNDFGQSLKGPNQVNWIKGAYAKYDKSSAFGLLTATFTHDNILGTNSVLHSVPDTNIKDITNNIYFYWNFCCANGGPQIKGK